LLKRIFSFETEYNGRGDYVLKKMFSHKILILSTIIVLILVSWFVCFILGGEKSAMTTMEKLHDSEFPSEILVWLDSDKLSEGYGAFYTDGHIYLAGRMGERPTGGYAILLGDVKQEGAQVIVTVQIKTPKPWDVVTQVITYPHTVTKLACPGEQPESALFMSTVGTVIARVEVKDLSTK